MKTNLIYATRTSLIAALRGLLFGYDTAIIPEATMGNDLNLCDHERRSQLLFGEAKDRNGYCSIRPIFRLFDDSFTLEDVKNYDQLPQWKFGISSFINYTLKRNLS